MKLDMLYSTYKERIYSLISNLPKYNCNANIIIVHQLDETDSYDLSDIQKRNDITYIPSYSKGVAKSRNIAIENAKSEIILFCDDDVVYESNFTKKIISLYEETDNKVITFAYRKEGRSDWGKFSEESYQHSLFSILSVGTIEVSCRLDAVKIANAKFPEDLGAGAKYFLCDEPVFLSYFIKKYKGRVKYYPVLIGTHPNESSGSLFNDFNAFKSRFLCFSYVFGKRAGLILYYVFLLKNIGKINYKFYKKAFVNVLFKD